MMWIHSAQGNLLITLVAHPASSFDFMLADPALGAHCARSTGPVDPRRKPARDPASADSLTVQVQVVFNQVLPVS